MAIELVAQLVFFFSVVALVAAQMALCRQVREQRRELERAWKMLDRLWTDLVSLRLIEGAVLPPKDRDA